MSDTLIEWAKKVWNPVTGCSKISEGCAHCYAERMAKRLAGRYGYPTDKPFAVTMHPDRLEEPLRVKKPSRFFVCSMGDLFHDDVPESFIDQILEVICCCPQHTFMILTKRPENMERKLYGTTTEAPFRFLGGGDYLENVWLGVTAENQQRANERIPILLQIPAAGCFVSYEPALGPIDFYLTRSDRVTHVLRSTSHYPGFEHTGKHENRISWVIAGGETGPGARPAHPDWFRQVRDQCKEAGVSFFFKNWGAYIPAVGVDETGDIYFPPAEHDTSIDPFGDGTYMLRVNREIKHLTRLLDGVEHNESPAIGR